MPLLLWFVMALDLEGIVSRWKAVAESVPVDKHPNVWVAHYGTSEDALERRLTEGPQERRNVLLGSLAATTEHTGSAVLYLASPWAVCAEVHETIVAVDVSHVLHVTHLIDEGKTRRSTDWRLSYGMGDDGSLRFGMAEKGVSPVWTEVQILWEARPAQKGSQTFERAFYEAFTEGNQAL